MWYVYVSICVCVLCVVLCMLCVLCVSCVLCMLCVLCVSYVLCMLCVLCVYVCRVFVCSVCIFVVFVVCSVCVVFVMCVCVSICLPWGRSGATRPPRPGGPRCGPRQAVGRGTSTWAQLGDTPGARLSATFSRPHIQGAGRGRSKQLSGEGRRRQPLV